MIVNDSVLVPPAGIEPGVKELVIEGATDAIADGGASRTTAPAATTAARAASHPTRPRVNLRIGFNMILS